MHAERMWLKRIGYHTLFYRPGYPIDEINSQWQSISINSNQYQLIDWYNWYSMKQICVTFYQLPSIPIAVDSLINIDWYRLLANFLLFHSMLADRNRRFISHLFMHWLLSDLILRNINRITKPIFSLLCHLFWQNGHWCQGTLTEKFR